MSVGASSATPSRSAGERWPSPGDLQQLAPVMRLIATISTIPQVIKISMSRGEVCINLWVFLAGDDYDAEAAISRAERAFLNSGSPPIVQIHVIPGTDVDPSMLPVTTVLLER